MITIHWNLIPFIIIVLLLLIKIRKSSGESKGDYGFDIETPFYVILLIAFVLIWGGIFWW
jgi:hypothetical protein